MSNSCRVCGKEDAKIVRNAIRGKETYCSYKCVLIGQSKNILAAGLFGAIITITLILIAALTSDRYFILYAYGIVAGVFSIGISSVSAIGFYFKRRYNRDKIAKPVKAR